MPRYFPTYTQVTISLMGPIAERIHETFPVAGTQPSEGPSDLQAPITLEQYEHAMKLNHLRSGINAAAQNLTLAAQVEGALSEIDAQKEALEDLSSNITQHSGSVATERQAEALKEASNHGRALFVVQETLTDQQKAVAQLNDEQKALSAQQVEQWNQFERQYTEQVIQALQKQGIDIDDNLLNNIVRNPMMTQDIIERMNKSDFEVPKALSGQTQDIHARIALKARLAVLLTLQGKVLDPEARQQQTDKAMKGLKSIVQDNTQKGDALSAQHAKESAELQTKQDVLSDDVQKTTQELAKSEANFKARLGEQEQALYQTSLSGRLPEEAADTRGAPTLGGHEE